METKKDLVTIVVPVYNVAKYLPRCIESLMGQTYPEIEVLLLDDGSTDNSFKICQQYAEHDSRINPIHKRNEGVSATRNYGINKASGRYICFVDSDDYVENDYVAALVEKIDERKLPFCGYIVDVYKTENIVSNKRLYGKSGVINIQDSLASIFHNGFLSVIWNKIYDVHFLRDHKIFFDTDISLGEDLIFNVKYLQTGISQFACIDKALYRYQRSGIQSLDNKYREDFLTIQERIFDSLIHAAEEFNLPLEQRSIIYSDFMAALIVSIDNYYTFHRGCSAEDLKSRIDKVCQSISEHEIVHKVQGIGKWICHGRYWLMKHGLYKVDFGIRNILKKILGL